MNTTVTGPARSGYLTVYPSGTSRPTASNVNFAAGQTVADLVTVPVGQGDAINLFNGSTGAVHLVADVAGYYTSGTATDGGMFKALRPARILDTRSGRGTAARPVARRAVLRVSSAAGGVPRAGVAAVVFTLTVTRPASAGYISVWPDGSARPVVSSLNFAPGATVANLVTVRVGSNSDIDFYNGSNGSVELVADIAGYYLAGSATRAGAFVPVKPARVLDTRNGTGSERAPVRAGSVRAATVTGVGGVPTEDVAAVATNLTVAGPTAAGYLLDYPRGSTRPNSSTLNFTRGRTVANAAMAAVGVDGAVDVVNGSTGATQIVADVTGYFLAAESAADTWTAPSGTGGRNGINPGMPKITPAAFQHMTPVAISPFVGVPVAGNGLVYELGGVGDAAQQSWAVQAINPETGQQVWQASVHGDTQVIGLLRLVGSVLYIAYDGDYYPETNPVGDETHPAGVAAINAQTGSVLWSNSVSAIGGGLDDTEPNDIEVDDGSVVVLTDGQVDGFDARTGNHLWSSQPYSANPRFPVAAGITASDGHLYVGADGVTEVWDERTGARLWSYDQLSGQVGITELSMTVPLVAAGHVLIARGNVLSSYDAAGCGRAVCPPQWSRAFPLLPSGDLVYVWPGAVEGGRAFVNYRADDNHLDILNLYTGAVVDDIPLANGLEGPPLVVGGYVWESNGGNWVAYPESCTAGCPAALSLPDDYATSDEIAITIYTNRMLVPAPN